MNQPAGQANTVHHGYTSNFPGPAHTIHANGNPAVAYKYSTFDVVHDNGLSTNLYTSKTRLGILDRSYDAASGAIDAIGVDNGRDKIDFAQLVDGGSAGIVSNFVTSMATTPRNYTFMHLVEPDTQGHASGWENQAWYDSVKVIDDRLAQIFNLIDNSATLRDHTAIVLTGDHGGGVDIHTNATAYVNYNVPLFVWGGGLPAGGDLYDLSPNRFDPGLTRPDYNAVEQPWRNGDTGNLALSLLGLPPIPGSTMQPALVPEPSSAVLAAIGVFGIGCFVRRRAR
ncbi:MAG: alkaline phosphatase family protein [Pirellulales bacterium]